MTPETLPEIDRLASGYCLADMLNMIRSRPNAWLHDLPSAALRIDNCSTAGRTDPLRGELIADHIRDCAIN